MLTSEKMKPLLPGKEEKTFENASDALAHIEKIYTHNTAYLRQEFDAFTSDAQTQTARVRACYPFIRIEVKTRQRHKTPLAFGYVSQPGTYESTVTRPDIFANYLLLQLSLLQENHHVPFTIGVSATPIPIHFALGESYHLEGVITPEKILELPNIFDLPDLVSMDDNIANYGFEQRNNTAHPLALFDAPRIDISLQRLKHYTGTDPVHFQNFVLFTNYGFYVDEFAKMARGLMAKRDPATDVGDEYEAFIEPGNIVTQNANLPQREYAPGKIPPRLPQMPAYHLARKDGSGITLVNIGVGPSNAKNITDHVAVLRPHAWLMLGHCAGLRNSQTLGDYVLAHAYLRQDHVLDEDVPLIIPIPALAEVQLALEHAVADVTGLTRAELKKIMRTGTVATTLDRNWELKDYYIPSKVLSQSRAVALDMESATIATNGFRFRVPYGTMLCVSDKPLHGQIKLPGMADEFYRRRVDQHLRIGIRTMELLRDVGMETLHSRKLRSFNEVAFQ
ncbi:MAG: amn [Alphaproteobacteria bacterium]|nr:amn [Alphaproteobacteria bacterium]